jgi:hypothetical protein
MKLVRATTTILRSLLLVVSIMLLGSPLTGCAGDENDPQTHVDRL